MNGWIKIHRSMLEWEHFNEPSVVTVFLALLMTAERDGVTNIKLDELMKFTGMSHNTVNRSIAKLVKSGEITREKRGQNIYTTITNWSEYQDKSLTQNLGQCDDLSTQNLGEQKEAIIPKSGSIIHPKIGTIIHPKIGSTIYNKNNKNNKNNTLNGARARMREEVMVDMMVETGCRSVGITAEQYRAIAEEIFNDWEFQDLPDSEWTKSHFLAVMRIKANVKRNEQRHEISGNTGDARDKLATDAVKAMAALAAESRQAAELPY